MQKQAADFAIQISKCKTIDELRSLWTVITSKRVTLGDEWYRWLADFKDGHKIRLTPTDSMEHLTKDGIKWLTKNV